MKPRILVSALCFCTAFILNAQWTGTNPVWTNSNVGIGMPDPGTSTLKIYRDTYPELKLADNKGSIAIQLAQNIGDNAPWAQPGDAIIRKFGLSHSINFVLNDDNNDGNSYFKFGDNYNHAVLSIFNNAKIIMNGSVGIGTTSLGTYKLNVWGKIRAHEVVVNTTGADFVFYPDYKLLSLLEVEKYIKENNHLPDLQSAIEMKENGMNVSEMQTKLLQKVEEMTLYIIDQNKAIEKQQQQIFEMEKEVKKLNKK